MEGLGDLGGAGLGGLDDVSWLVGTYSLEFMNDRDGFNMFLLS